MTGRHVSRYWVALTVFAMLLGANTFNWRPSTSRGEGASTGTGIGPSQTPEEGRSAPPTKDQQQAPEQNGASLPAQAAVEKMEWKWVDGQSNPFYCAERLGDDYIADFVPVPRDASTLLIHLSHDGKDVFSWKGHKHSVFVRRGDVLYYADFNPRRTGCAVVAYDLVSRKQLWKAGLRGIEVRSHSNYSNRINMAINQKHLIIYGKESYGCYIELVDLQTGKTVGHKLVPMP